jgi:iron complex outermembrane receptor protein
VQPTAAVTLDFAAFANVYDDLRSFDAGAPAFNPTAAPPRITVPIGVNNKLSGETYGFEVAANWNVTPDWRLSAAYTFITLSLHQSSDSTDAATQAQDEGTSPRNQVQLHSYYNLIKDLELNGSVYYVENLRTGDVPSYVRVDANVTWRPRPGLELAVGVQNALDDRHPEFGSVVNTVSSEVPRSVFAQLVWRY